jgi:hypothetical protein
LPLALLKQADNGLCEQVSDLTFKSILTYIYIYMTRGRSYDRKQFFSSFEKRSIPL